MVCSLYSYFPLACAGVFAAKRTLRYLKFLQQETYTNSRFLLWFKRKLAFDKRGSALCIIGAALSAQCSSCGIGAPATFIVGLGLLALAIFEEDPRKTGKVKLVMTQRASKIWGLSVALVAIATISVLWLLNENLNSNLNVWAMLLSLVLIQAAPFILLLSNTLLWPFEKALQDNFKSEAIDKLKNVDPLIIGITGSYGKTSVKAILGDILNQAVAPTYWPRGSINTVMGITRDIREKMTNSHRFAIIEMGAYGIGSIKRLCDFTPPKAAIVTAVGVMHLERFKDPNVIYRAKSELAQALPKDGILVCNGDNPGARKMALEFPSGKNILYGLEPQNGHLDCLATDIKFSSSGTSFTINWLGKSYPATTPLLGKPALSNILAAFSMACALGAKPEYAAATLSNLEPVENRLSVEKTKTAVWLKDAFNSNPDGFAAALDVLKSFDGTRKILITPGMIELGSIQAAENEKIAAKAASIINLAIIVGPTNREALVKGLKAGGFDESNIICIDTRDEGFKKLNSLLQKGDAVLVENDLPDLYEGPVKF